MKLLVFTAGFFDKDYEEKLHRLEASCQKYKIDVVSYGKGRFFSFFDSKIVELGTFLSLHQNDYTHALYTDASDSFFLTDLKEIIDKYQRFNSPLVLSGEKSCYPYGEYSESFPPSPTRYRYFNAGGFIGEIPYILGVLSKLKAYHFLNDNDNAHWMQAYLMGKIKLDIDYQCEIFQTMSGAEFDQEFEFEDIYTYPHNDQFLRNKITGSYPAIVHFNGPKDKSTPNFRLMDHVFRRCILGEKDHIWLKE